MEFEGINEVVINIVNGNVTIEGWEEERVSVEYEVVGSAYPEIKRMDDILIIKEKLKRRGLFRKGKGHVSFNLRVPKTARVIFQTVNGDLRAKECTIEAIQTVNGNVSIENCDVERIQSVNGDIKAYFEELESDLHINTTNGDIKIKLTELADAIINFKSTNGEMRLFGLDEPTIGTGDFEINVKTVNGDLEVFLV